MCIKTQYWNITITQIGVKHFGYYKAKNTKNKIIQNYITRIVHVNPPKKN